MNFTIRLIEKEESDKFFELIERNRSRLKKYFPNTVREVGSKKDAAHHLLVSHEQMEKKEKYLFGLYCKDELIGYTNVKNFDWEIPKCELGYFIDEAYEGRGLMTKMVKNISDYCFEELKVLKVFLRIAKENQGSIKIAERTGFIKEGSLKKEFRLESGELIDVEYYGKINEVALSV